MTLDKQSRGQATTPGAGPRSCFAPAVKNIGQELNAE